MAWQVTSGRYGSRSDVVRVSACSRNMRSSLPPLQDALVEGENSAAAAPLDRGEPLVPARSASEAGFSRQADALSPEMVRPPVTQKRRWSSH